MADKEEEEERRGEEIGCDGCEDEIGDEGNGCEEAGEIGCVVVGWLNEEEEGDEGFGGCEEIEGTEERGAEEVVEEEISLSYE